MSHGHHHHHHHRHHAQSTTSDAEKREESHTMDTETDDPHDDIRARIARIGRKLLMESDDTMVPRKTPC